MKRENRTSNGERVLSTQALHGLGRMDAPDAQTSDAAHLDARLSRLWELLSPEQTKHDQRVHDALDYLVVQATKGSLEKLDQGVAETFALIFWYKNEDMREALENRLKRPGLAPVRKRRLMYLVDRLRRFPCMKHEHAVQMKQLVSRWQDLSRHVSGKLVEKAQKMNQYDKVAATWGLAEPVGNLMGKVLDLQTRHFVDAHHLPNGYTELTTRRGATSQ